MNNMFQKLTAGVLMSVAMWGAPSDAMAQNGADKPIISMWIAVSEWLKPKFPLRFLIMNPSLLSAQQYNAA